MKKYDFLVETLTPLHIGSGENIIKMEYFLENNTFYICDFYKILEFLSNNIDIEKNFDRIINKDKLEDIFKEFEKDLKEKGIDIHSKKWDFVIRKIKGYPNYVEIKEFIKHSNNKLYIPSSSIKGAIVNSIDKKLSGIIFRDIEGDFQSRLIRYERIGAKMKLINYECIEVNKKDNIIFSIISQDNLNISEFIKNVNKFYLDRLKRIIERFKNHTEVVLNLKEIEKQFKDDSSMIIQLGFGGGYYLKSRFINKNVKTLAVFENKHPGWIKFSLM